MYLNKWSDSLHPVELSLVHFYRCFFVISNIVISRVDRISQRLYGFPFSSQPEDIQRTANHASPLP